MNNIINKKQIKLLKRKITALFWSVSSMDFVNELMLWSKQFLNLTKITNLDNEKEIDKKAIDLKNTIENTINSKLKMYSNLDENLPFLTRAKNVFNDQEYFEFRDHWYELELILNKSNDYSSILKIKKLNDLAHFWKKYLINSQNTEIV